MQRDNPSIIRYPSRILIHCRDICSKTNVAFPSCTRRIRVQLQGRAHNAQEHDHKIQKLSSQNVATGVRTSGPKYVAAKQILTQLSRFMHYRIQNFKGAGFPLISIPLFLGIAK
ncbi:hypothetical protein LOAG_00566 [Loa loa]|uniref:Uncharacterized protein n=1 Tax=Loa loa TaxID=7209 RepID=A0A1S0UAW8_LOALO|nr:hypothetical protein LOAG_00566 [Loa loa]EFO27929.1 hypothetical protein LOAG_00566 [Loa loa]